MDWKRTKAYARGNFGQIFLNVKGREPQGIVQPGDDYVRTVDEIIARLPTLIDPTTGQQIVQRAERREALFNGPQIDRAPDIAVFMRDETYVGLGTADFPANTVAEKAIGNTGDHRYNGILLMSGRGVERGDLGRASLLDIAPTVLHLLGQPVPSDMDGEVLLKGLNAEFQQVEMVEVEADSAPETVKTDYTAEEEKEIMQHLQDLGYLG